MATRWRFPLGVALAVLAAPVLGASAFAASPQPETGTITAAEYAEPTTRYDHGVLGDAVEWGALVMTLSDGSRHLIRLPETRVFEDTSPRLADLDGDGTPEVIVVETDTSLGAQLAVYDAGGKVTATPHIGRSNRWLAPIGAADLDGDGKTEIAYVDRPHLAKTVMILRYDDRKLTRVAQRDGFTNHRIGDSEIAGGIRQCNSDTPEMIVADGGWRELYALQFDGQRITDRPLGPLRASGDFDAALACPDKTPQ